MRTALFDAITRDLGTVSTRRGIFRLLGGAAAASSVGLIAGQDADAKAKRRGKSNGRAQVDAQRKKNDCPPCKKRKNGKCKSTQPDGSSCPGGTCQSGACFAPDGSRTDTNTNTGNGSGGNGSDGNGNGNGSSGNGGCTPECGFNTVCQNGTCVPAANHCPAPFTCPDPFGGPAPVCGSTAGGGTCACYTSTEGNNICVNNDVDYKTLTTCTSTQQCRDTVGFHFYCKAVHTSPSGKICGSDVGRCFPECDNRA